MPFLFAPPAQPVIPVQDERYEFFPVRRVFCVAGSYAKAGTPGAKPQLHIFMKPADAVVPIGPNDVFDMAVEEDEEPLMPEVELVACLSKGGRAMSLEEAADAVWGWCVGIDFTKPELRARLAAAGSSWERAKAFEGSAPVSYVRPDYRSPMPAPADLYLYVGNERRQHGSTGEMTWSAAEIIAEISKTWTLQPGDVVFTGTPAGARPVKRGDLILAGVNGVGSLRVQIH